mgnify:CR=1 FL=1
MHEVDAGLALEQLAGEMDRAAGAGRGVSELAGLLLGERDEIGDDAYLRLEEELDWAELSATPRDEVSP